MDNISIQSFESYNINDILKIPMATEYVTFAEDETKKYVDVFQYLYNFRTQYNTHQDLKFCLYDLTFTAEKNSKTKSKIDEFFRNLKDGDSFLKSLKSRRIAIVATSNLIVNKYYQQVCKHEIIENFIGENILFLVECVLSCRTADNKIFPKSVEQAINVLNSNNEFCNSIKGKKFVRLNLSVVHKTCGDNLILSEVPIFNFQNELEMDTQLNPLSPKDSSYWVSLLSCQKEDDQIYLNFDEIIYTFVVEVGGYIRIDPNFKKEYLSIELLKIWETCVAKAAYLLNGKLSNAEPIQFILSKLKGTTVENTVLKSIILPVLYSHLPQIFSNSSDPSLLLSSKGGAQFYLFRIVSEVDKLCEFEIQLASSDLVNLFFCEQRGSLERENSSFDIEMDIFHFDESDVDFGCEDENSYFAHDLFESLTTPVSTTFLQPPTLISTPSTPLILPLKKARLNTTENTFINRSPGKQSLHATEYAQIANSKCVLNIYYYNYIIQTHLYSSWDDHPIICPSIIYMFQKIRKGTCLSFSDNLEFWLNMLFFALSKKTHSIGIFIQSKPESDSFFEAILNSIFAYDHMSEKRILSAVELKNRVVSTILNSTNDCLEIYRTSTDQLKGKFSTPVSPFKLHTEYVEDLRASFIEYFNEYQNRTDMFPHKLVFEYTARYLKTKIDLFQNDIDVNPYGMWTVYGSEDFENNLFVVCSKIKFFGYVPDIILRKERLSLSEATRSVIY